MAKPCEMVMNTRLGALSEKKHFPSVRSAIRYAKECDLYFAYRIFVNGVFHRRGFCGGAE